VINNPKTARIIAAIVIAMMVLTLAAALFGCSATNNSSSDSKATATNTSETRTSASKDPYSGLTLVAVEHLPQEAQQSSKLVAKGGAEADGGLADE
jgi:ribonuclease T1